MQPFDYRLAVQNPVQMALQGYLQGQQMVGQREEAAMNRELFDLKKQEYQANQAKLAQEQAFAQQMQADLGQFATDLADNNATYDQYVRLKLAYGDTMGEQIDAAYQGKTQEFKDASARKIASIAIAFRSDPVLGMQRLQEEKAAAADSGDQQLIDSLEMMETEAKISPGVPMASSMFLMESLVTPEQAERFAKMLAPEKQELRETTLGNEIVLYDPTSPDAKSTIQVLGAAPVKSPLVEITNGEPSGVEVTEQAFREKYGANLATQVGTLSDNALSAGRNIKLLGQLETAFATAPSGTEAGLKLFAGSLGIPSEGINAAQAADAIINSLIPKQREEGSGSSSDKDVESFKRSLPSLLQTPEGRLQVLRNLRAMNEYAIKEGQIANRLARGEAGFGIAEYQDALAALGSPLGDGGGGSSTTPATGKTAITNTARAEGITEAEWNAMTPEEKALFGD